MSAHAGSWSDLGGRTGENTAAIGFVERPSVIEPVNRNEYSSICGWALESGQTYREYSAYIARQHVIAA